MVSNRNALEMLLSKGCVIGRVGIDMEAKEKECCLLCRTDAGAFKKYGQTTIV